MMFFLYLLYTIFVLIIGMKTAEKWHQMSGELIELESKPPLPILNATTEKKRENIPPIEEEIPEFVSNHLPDDCCTFKVVKFINPFKDVCPKGKTAVVSVCLKCAMCLAIAEKIQSIFDGTETYADLSPECVTDDVACKLKYVCKHGFKNYDLRNYDGYTIVTEASKSTNHVKSVLDGIWTVSLQKMCSKFLYSMEVFDVYNQYKKGTVDLKNFLCRGSGIFRECQNLHFDAIDFPNESKYWINCLF